jgi:hypothetical protein
LALIIIALPASVLAYRGHSNRQHHWQKQQSHQTPPPAQTPPPVVPPPVPPPTTGSGITLLNVYTTGYANADNTPAGSNATNLGGHSGVTGGTGTYANPTTVAVGGSIINGKEIDDFPYGTIFYIPHFQKYFIATDFCGDGNTPQNQPCHSLAQAPKGATLWLDLWVGGGSANQNTCESNMTGLNTVYENPPSNLPVVSGEIC